MLAELTHCYNSGAPKLGGDSIGNRIFKVRLALGDGLRKPLSMRKFVALVERETGRKIHASELSGIERGKRTEVAANDAMAIADVDPLERGVEWLIRGTVPDVPVALTEPAPDAAQSLEEEQGPDNQTPPAPRKRFGGRGH